MFVLRIGQRPEARLLSAYGVRLHRAALPRRSADFDQPGSHGSIESYAVSSHVSNIP